MNNVVTVEFTEDEARQLERLLRRGGWVALAERVKLAREDDRVTNEEEP